MESAVLIGKLREKGGKAHVKKVRRENLLPAVLYGQKDHKLLKVDPKELRKILEIGGQNTLITLNLEGDSNKERKVLLKDCQTHPLKDDWVHIDFFEVDLAKTTQVSVPVKLVSQSPGEKMGGIVNFVTTKVEVECLPSNIPKAFEVDMSGVQLGDSIHISDLSQSDDIKILDDPAGTVVTVVLEKVEEPEKEGEEEAVAGEAEAKTPDKKEE